MASTHGSQKKKGINIWMAGMIRRRAEEGDRSARSCFRTANMPLPHILPWSACHYCSEKFQDESRH